MESENFEVKKEEKMKKKRSKREKRERRPDNANTKKVKRIGITIVIVLAIIFLLALAYLIYDGLFKKGEALKKGIEVDASELRLNVVDLKSDTRPFAVMIGNTREAWPQFNVNEALVVYEMHVEGGITRIMAIFKDKDLDKIGPIRSARHYFLDYVKEYDAIYAHEGHSPRGGSEIHTRNIDSVADSFTSSGDLYYRDENKYAPHNAITSTKRIIDAAKSEGYSLTTKKGLPLKYSRIPVNYENSVSAKTIIADFSYVYDIKLEYNEENKKYEKHENGELLKDGASNKPLAATNIIMLHADNSPLYGYGEGQGRIDIDTTQDMTGYFFSHGKGVKIKAKKDDINSQTKYFLEDGKELRINDGNTFIFLIPYSEEIKIIPGKKIETKEENNIEDYLNDERIKIKDINY